MKRTILTGVTLLAVFMIWASQVPAATTPAEPVKATEPAHWHTITNDFMDAFHHPFDGLEMGLDLRLRDEYNHNSTSLNDQYGDDRGGVHPSKPGNWNEENGQRYRMRWSTVWTLAPDVTFNTRLVWEFWTFNTERSSSKATSEQNLDLREMIFDCLNIKWKNAFDVPMTLTVGRQDVKLGTGWLVNEGTPGDGSRTYFFDAVRATVDLSEKTQLDLIGIAQSDDERGWMTPMNHREYLHSTQKTDETGFIAYLTDNSIENTTLEGYYIYKKEEPSSWAKFSESWWAAAPGKDAEIHTFGGRIAQKLGTNWSYSIEAAKQFGKKDTGISTEDMESMSGLGTNNKLVYAFNDDMKNELRLTQEYLSGNDRHTGGSEAFDPLWGDWPQPQRGGDLVPNLFSSESAKSEVTNLQRVGVGHTIKPTKEWTFMTDYNLLWANENTKAGQVASNNGVKFANSGKFRGQLFSGVAKYSCCKNFSAFLAVDYFVPGNYYDQSTRNHAVFARINFEWTF